MRSLRFTTQLTATVIVTYLLFALGAMTAAAGGSTPLAWGHYIAAAAGWLFVAVTAVRSSLESHDRGVTAGLIAATLFYLGQGLAGLFGRIRGASDVGEFHLFGAILVFGVLLLSLVRHLDREVAGTGSGASRGTGASKGKGATRDSEPHVPDDGQNGDAGTDGFEDADPESGVPDRSVPRGRIHDRIRSYVALTKPRLMWLLCLLALAGMALARIAAPTSSGGAITGTGAAATTVTLDGVTVLATLTGGVLAIGASGTFNHVFERDRDRRMERTADRPIATAQVPVRRATAFGIGLTILSLSVLWTYVTPLSTLLTAVAIIYYAVVYTVMLKPNTRWNTAIGGGSGALPALIGWTAVTGSIGLPAIMLTVLVVAWTPAHFYNLAIAYREDYAAGGYPMLPVVEGVSATRRRTCYWLGGTLVVTVLLGVVADLGVLYAVVTTVAATVFLRSIVRQYELGTDRAAYRTFHASNAYLGAVLAAVLLEALLV
ncbi:heme o synthase [Halopenitus sp. H-Gu1]|uniref:heme o synthase n=1 Tax=Halopenitus sp. H-Gu1 TaxID=3242697 RepID=UPI00359D3DA6